MLKIYLAIAFAVGPLAILLRAADTTICRPNQYPSPTVKQPAADNLFERDYPWDVNTLTGDWGGLRRQLADHGIVLEGRYVSLLMANTHGGLDTGFFGAGPLGLTATIDTDKLINLDGGKLFFDWEFNHWLNGRFPPDGQFDPTGSYVGVNTNLIGSDAAELNQLAQLYYEQSLAGDRISLAFGKIDANVPFANAQAAGPFQNSIAMYTSTLNPFFPTYHNEATALVARAGDVDFVSTKFGWFHGGGSPPPRRRQPGPTQRPGARLFISRRRALTRPI